MSSFSREVRRHWRVLGRVEEVVLHELADELDIDVHSTLEFGWVRACQQAAMWKVCVLLEALGSNHLPEQVHYIFGLQRNLHLAGRVIEQVAPVILALGLAEVVGGAALVCLHGLLGAAMRP